MRSRFARLLSLPEDLNGDGAGLLAWIRRRGGESYAREAAAVYARRAQSLLQSFPDCERAGIPTVGLHPKFRGNVTELSARIPHHPLRESPTRFAPGYSVP